MKAFIFDFDGVIVDSQSHWDRLSFDHMSKLIPGWTMQDDMKLRGHSMDDNYRMLVADYGVAFSRDEFLMHVEQMGLDVYKIHASLTHGLLPLLERLKAFSIPLPAIASASRHAWLAHAVNRLALAPHFSSITTTEEVPRGKPHPDVYLKAAEKLGIPPEQCVAVEDTDPGMTAAKAAGMTAIGLHSSPKHEQPLAQADIHIDSFDELTPDVLASLLA